jgi:hypothetical protein
MTCLPEDVGAVVLARSDDAPVSTRSEHDVGAGNTGYVGCSSTGLTSPAGSHNVAVARERRFALDSSSSTTATQLPSLRLSQAMS